MLAENLIDSLQKVRAMTKQQGFDEFHIEAASVRKFAVRIALSRITRENLLTDQLMLHLSASVDGKSLAENIPYDPELEIEQWVLNFSDKLRRQSSNREYVASPKYQGQFRWRMQEQSIDQVYSPAALYPLLEKHMARVRERGLRVTGYLEIMELHRRCYLDDSVEMDFFNHGVMLSLTIDNQEGATGVARESFIYASPDELDQAFARNFDSAIEMCEKNRNAAVIEPGDYTVILSPSAVADLLTTSLFYRFFDRREIDENHTYLKPAMIDELTFPKGLKLDISTSFDWQGVPYSEPPLNSRMARCEPMSLIRDGRLQDFFYSPYWAQQADRPETFESAYRPPLLMAADSDADLELTDQLEGLIQSTKQGIYIASLWYIRMVNPAEGVLTGMTRDAIFEIKDGELTRPLVHMRWHQNPITLLQNIDGMTQSRELHGLSRFAGQSRMPLCYVPALRAKDFHFSSVTKF